MKHDYEGGRTWEEEGLADDNRDNTNQRANAAVRSARNFASENGADSLDDPNMSEEDRIVAQTRAALQEYGDAYGDNTEMNDVHGTSDRSYAGRAGAGSFPPSGEDDLVDDDFYPYNPANWGAGAQRSGARPAAANKSGANTSAGTPYGKNYGYGSEYDGAAGDDRGAASDYGRYDYAAPGRGGSQSGADRLDPHSDTAAQTQALRRQRQDLERERKRLAKEKKRLQKENKALKKENKKYQQSSAAVDNRYYDEDDYDDRRDGSRNNRKADRRSSNGRGKDGRKRHHPVRNFFIILLILLILVPILWILVQVRTMQSMGMDNEEIQNSIADSVKEDIKNGSAQGDYKNVAILGVDSVDNSLDSGNNRSDVMIIASVNNKTGAIKLMSVYRDTYLDIGDGNYQKANAAYAFGGPDQTVQMLNRNLDLDITDYGVVGFEGIARLIDAVGGVDIDVQEDEIVHLNNYQLTMSQETGLTNIPVTHAGMQTLNGLQATAYCRIRYTSGNDFRRTERQRTVLTKTFEKIKANPARLVMNLNNILPYVKTSLSVPEMFSLGAKAMNFNVESQEGFPSQDLLTVGYINQQSCIIPITLAKNVTWLHSELFGETDYQPSDTVQQISSYISSVTGYY